MWSVSCGGFDMTKKTNHLPLVQDSGTQEYYTDALIIELAREVLGQIDLDPASNHIANITVQAATYFTREDDGLSREWHGKVWLNHPFSKGELPCARYLKDTKYHKKGDYNCKKRICNDPTYKNYRGYHIDHKIPSNLDWITFLKYQHEKGNTVEAINVAFAELSSSWGTILLDGVHCIPFERVNYFGLEADGSIKKQRGVPKGSIIRYWGDNPDKFARVFSQIGSIQSPY